MNLQWIISSWQHLYVCWWVHDLHSHKRLVGRGLWTRPESPFHPHVLTMGLCPHSATVYTPIPHMKRQLRITAPQPYEPKFAYLVTFLHISVLSLRAQHNAMWQLNIPPDTTWHVGTWHSMRQHNVLQYDTEHCATI